MLKERFTKLANKLAQKWKIYQFRRVCKSFFQEPNLSAIQRSKIGIDSDLKLIMILCQSERDQCQLRFFGRYQLAIAAKKVGLKHIRILSTEDCFYFSVKGALWAMEIERRQRG